MVNAISAVAGYILFALMVIFMIIAAVFFTTAAARSEARHQESKARAAEAADQSTPGL